VALSEPETRSARENARRRCASSKQARLGCRYAPRPGRRAWGSGTRPSPSTTRRSRLDFSARALQPTQVRTGGFPDSGSSARAVIATLVYPVFPVRLRALLAPALSLVTRPKPPRSSVRGQGRALWLAGERRPRSPSVAASAGERIPFRFGSVDGRGTRARCCCVSTFRGLSRAADAPAHRLFPWFLRTPLGLRECASRRAEAAGILLTPNGFAGEASEPYSPLSVRIYDPRNRT
jgi:hypothetical protein